MSTDQELITRARRLFESGRFGEAETFYRELAGQHPANPDVRIMLATCRKAQGDTQAARTELDAAIELDPDYAEGHFQRGQLLRQLGEPGAARESLDRAVELNPNHVGARVVRARLAHELGDSAAAVDGLKSALRADENNVAALTELAHVLLDAGRPSEADRYASQAVRLQPRDSRAQMVMAQVFQAREQWDFAEQCLKNALEQAPQSAGLWAALGGLYQAAGRDDDAVEAFTRAERLPGGAGDNPVTALAMARSLYATGRYAAARQRMERLARHAQLDGDLLLFLAELRVLDGDTGAAGGLLGELDEQRPAAARLLRAWLAQAAGDADAAAEQAGELHADDDDEVARHARLLSGRLALENRRRADGEKALRPLVDGESPDIEAGWLLADLVLADDDAAAAGQVLGRLLSAGEPNPARRSMTHCRLARALDRAGDAQQAAGHLERAAWRGVLPMARITAAVGDALWQALEGMDELPWADRPIDDGRHAPLFVLGWPGSGREWLLRALAECGLPQLPAAEAQRRRHALGLPSAPADLAGRGESGIILARKRYLRSVRESGHTALEPAWFEAAALPAIARHFPHAAVIVPVADSRDLELHWRMNGYGHIGQTVALHERDRALLAHLRTHLPLNVIEVARAELAGEPEKAAARLADSLPQVETETLAAALAGAGRADPGFPDGHWRHYDEALVSAEPAPSSS